MATNRTATTKWKSKRKTVIYDARSRGLRNCPLCNRVLNWNNYQQPDSAEVDHILPVALGGNDELENLRVICRQCNQSRGTKPQAQKGPKHVIDIEHHEHSRTTRYNDGSSVTNLIDW